MGSDYRETRLKDKPLNQQLDELVFLGNKNGLHDAADWLRIQVESARLIFNLERERLEQTAYLDRLKGERLTRTELRERLQKTFPGLSVPKAHTLVSKWLAENGNISTVHGDVVS